MSRARTGRRGPGGVLVAVVAIGALAGCGGADGHRSASDGSVAVPVAGGVVEVSTVRTGIWALEEATALNLLALDVRAAHVGGLIEDPVARALLADGGVRPVEEIEAERLIQDDPSLVLGRQHPRLEDLGEQLGGIVPLAVYPDRLPWQEQLRLAGAITDRADRADAIVRRVEERIDALAARVAAAGLEGTVVSVLAEYPDGYYAFDDGTVFGEILGRLGLERPPGQVDDDDDDYGFAPVSEELLDDHGAEVVISLVDDVHTGGRSVLDHPALAGAARRAEVAYLPWYSTGPLNALWVAHDLAAILLGEGDIATAADAPALWTDLLGQP